MCCSKVYSCSFMKFYPPYLAKILGFWVTCRAKMMLLRQGWGWKPPQTTSPIHIRHIQSVWAHWCAVQRHTVAALWSSTYPTWLRFWVLGNMSIQNDAITSWLRLTATSNNSPIYFGHIQSVWVHWYDVKRHTVAALWSSTHPTWLRFWGSGSHVKLKWCHYVTVEADSHLKQLLPSTLDIYKVF